MFGIIGNGGIASSGISSRWICVDGGKREKSMRPGVTTISGCSPSNIGRASIKEATNLEGRDDRVAKGKGVWFDLCLVQTIRVLVGIGTDPDERFIGRDDEA